MPCFVLVTYPDGKTAFLRNYTDRAEAVASIRMRLKQKSLITSASTYRIFYYEGAETFNEDNMP